MCLSDAFDKMNSVWYKCSRLAFFVYTAVKEIRKKSSYYRNACKMCSYLMKWLGANSFALLDLHVLRLLNVVIATCAS